MIADKKSTEEVVKILSILNEDRPETNKDMKENTESVPLSHIGVWAKTVDNKRKTEEKRVNTEEKV